MKTSDMTARHLGGPSVSVFNMLVQRRHVLQHRRREVHNVLRSPSIRPTFLETFAFLETFLNLSRCQPGTLKLTGRHESLRKATSPGPRRIFSSTQSLPARNLNSQKRITYVCRKGKRDTLQQSLTRSATASLEKPKSHSRPATPEAGSRVRVGAE